MEKASAHPTRSQPIGPCSSLLLLPKIIAQSCHNALPMLTARVNSKTVPASWQLQHPTVRLCAIVAHFADACGNVQTAYSPFLPSVVCFMLVQELLPDPDRLSVKTAQEDVIQSLVALENTWHYLSKGTHGFHCDNGEWAILARVDTLAKQCCSVLEYWGQAQCAQYGLAWLDLVRRVLCQAQIMFEDCSWALYEPAQDGLRNGIMLFIKDCQLRERLLWDVNNMRPASAASGRRASSQLSNGSQLFSQIRQRRRTGL